MTKKTGTDTDPTDTKPRRARKPRTDSAQARLNKVLGRLDEIARLLHGGDTTQIERAQLLAEEAIVIGTGEDVEAFLRARLGL